MYISNELEAPHITYDVACFDKDGNVRWKETVVNLVMTGGKNDLADKYLKGAAYTAAWYILLKGTGAIAAADTLASHPGWSEANPYTGNRPAVTWGTTTGGSNTASAVNFAITAAGPTTVAGCGLCTVNTGTSGVLYSAVDFAASRSVYAGDTLQITATWSAT